MSVDSRTSRNSRASYCSFFQTTKSMVSQMSELDLWQMTCYANTVAIANVVAASWWAWESEVVGSLRWPLLRQKYRIQHLFLLNNSPRRYPSSLQSDYLVFLRCCSTWIFPFPMLVFGCVFSLAHRTKEGPMCIWYIVDAACHIEKQYSIASS